MALDLQLRVARVPSQVFPHWQSTHYALLPGGRSCCAFQECPSLCMRYVPFSPARVLPRDRGSRSASHTVSPLVPDLCFSHSRHVSGCH